MRKQAGKGWILPELTSQEIETWGRRSGTREGRKGGGRRRGHRTPRNHRLHTHTHTHTRTYIPTRPLFLWASGPSPPCDQPQSTRYRSSKKKKWQFKSNFLSPISKTKILGHPIYSKYCYCVSPHQQAVSRVSRLQSTFQSRDDLDWPTRTHEQQA